MLSTLRVLAIILFVLVIPALIWYLSHFLSLSGSSNKKIFLLNDPKYCRWPPVTSNDIRTGSNTYNLTLCIKVDPLLLPVNSVPTYPIQSLFRNAPDNKNVSFKEIGECDRSICNQPIYPDVYRTYPQDVPMKEVVKAIQSGRPAPVLPDYNSPIQILRTSKSVCSGNTSHDLVIVVKSGILGWERRRPFRAYMQRQKALYPNIKLGVVFSLGMPRQHGGRIFNRDGHITRLEGVAGDLLDEYIGKSSEVMQRIEEEMKTYDDIVLADYEDTYFNLSLKTVTNLRWLSAFCDKVHNDVFMIIDDDHRMNASMLMEFLASLPKDRKRTAMFGRIAKADGATRTPLSKLYLSYREVPWNVMSPYPHGFCQLIGADIVDEMAIASAYTRHNYIHEDVYLGLLALKLGIRLEHVNNMIGHREFEYRKLPVSKVMVAHSNYMNITLLPLPSVA